MAETALRRKAWILGENLVSNLAVLLNWGEGGKTEFILPPKHNALMRKTAEYREVTIYSSIIQYLLFLFATDLLTWSKKVKRRREWRRKDHRLQRHLPQRR